MMLRSILQTGRASILQPLINTETYLAQQTRVSITIIIYFKLIPIYITSNRSLPSFSDFPEYIRFEKAMGTTFGKKRSSAS